jgi:hypothetical protein
MRGPNAARRCARDSTTVGGERLGGAYLYKLSHSFTNLAP